MRPAAASALMPTIEMPKRSLIGFKRSELGLIPNDWIVISIADIATVIRGASPRPKGDKRYYGGSVPRLMVEDVTRDKKWVTPSIDFLTEQGAKLSRHCKKGTLTMVCSGTPTVVGLPSLLAVDACIHDGMLGLVNLHKKISADYLFHLLTSLQTSLHASATHGGTFVNLTTTGLRAFKFVVPNSINEQDAIAKALSDADTLIASLEQLVAKKRAIKQGAMQELIAGKRRLPGFKGAWSEKCIDDISTVGRGRVISHKEISRSNNPLYPVYSSQTSNSGVMGYLDTFMFEGDYITWTTDGANAGTVFCRSGRFNCTNVCGTIKLKSGNHYFVASVLGTITPAHVSKHLGNPKLMNDVMKRIKIPFPPSSAEQDAIALALSDMDVEINLLEAKLSKSRQIRQGMMQELLTGRIRLI